MKRLLLFAVILAIAFYGTLVAQESAPAAPAGTSLASVDVPDNTKQAGDPGPPIDADSSQSYFHWVLLPFLWGGWTGVSALAQLLLAILAFYTIYYGMRKEKDQLTQNDIDFIFPENKNKEHIRILIRNRGASPIYIIRCGIRLGDKKDAQRIEFEVLEAFPINVRESKYVDSSILRLFSQELEAKTEKGVGINDSVYAYVETAPGKIVSKKTEYNFGSLKIACAEGAYTDRANADRKKQTQTQ